MTSMIVVIVIEMDPFKFIDENLPDLSGFPNFLFARFFFLDMVTVTLVVP